MPDGEQDKTRMLVEILREVRALHQMTFGVHDPENEVAIAAADRLKVLFAGVMKVGASPDLLISAVGWLEKMQGSNQNPKIREALARGVAQFRR